jgi:PAS domain S-box-containing protein
MAEAGKTKEQLLKELAELRQRMAELEASEIRQHRVVEAWRDLWAQYEAMIEAFDGLIYICSQNYEIEFMNQRFIELAGSNYQGQKCYNALHDRDSVCPWCVNEAVFRGQKVSGDILSAKNNRWYHVVNTPIHHPDGSLSKMAMITDITERKQAEEALRQSEERYHKLFDGVPVGLYRTTPEGQFLDANPALVQMLGYKPTKSLQRINVADLYVDAAARQRWQNLLERKGLVRDFEVQLRRADGTSIWVVNSARAVREGDGQVLYYEGSLRDITEHKQAEEKLSRATRALKTLSACNHSLVHATEESAFLDDICRIIVEVGGYRLAWVGFALQDEGKTVRPVAQAGFEKGYLKTVNITWADTERGRGPTGTAIRTGKTRIVQNMTTDPAYAPWRAEALRRGYASSIALPLLEEGWAMGAVNIYAKEPDAFDDEEVKLLEELARSVAYGIVALRTRAELKN